MLLQLPHAGESYKAVIVSIPQAVGVVATVNETVNSNGSTNYLGFNTASGRCCCNTIINAVKALQLPVSIPQAVGVVATLEMSYIWKLIHVSIPQAVGVVATTERSFCCFN